MNSIDSGPFEPSALSVENSHVRVAKAIFRGFLKCSIVLQTWVRFFARPDVFFAPWILQPTWAIILQPPSNPTLGPHKATSSQRINSAQEFQSDHVNGWPSRRSHGQSSPFDHRPVQMSPEKNHSHCHHDKSHLDDYHDSSIIISEDPLAARNREVWMGCWKSGGQYHPRLVKTVVRKHNAIYIRGSLDSCSKAINGFWMNNE